MTNSVTAAPTISGVSPSSGPTSGGTNVTVTGTGFALPDTISNNWITNANTLPAPRLASSVIRIGTQLYMFGGCADENLSTPTNTIFTASVNNPTVWTNTGKTLPGVNCGASIEQIGTTLYMFGGTNNGTALSSIWSASTSDPTTWTNTGANLPGARTRGKTAVVGTTIYYYGGFTTGSYAGSNTIFSAPTSNPTSWTNTGSTLPANLGEFELTTVGNTMYILGGYGNGQSSAIYSAPTSNPTSWTYTGANLPAPMHSPMLVTVGTNMYIMGGYGTSGVIQNIYQASTSAPTVWTDTGKVALNMLSRSTIINVGTSAYIFGGGTTSAASSAILVSAGGYSGTPPTLTFDGIAANNLLVLSPTSATATAPAHSSGTVNVVMTNPDSTTSTLANSYTYLPPPVINGVSPSTINNIGGDIVTVSGTNFVNGGVLMFGNVTVSYTFINDTTLTFVAPPYSLGKVNLTYTNPDNQTSTLSDALTVKSLPRINSMSPTSGPQSGGTKVTLTGTGFIPPNKSVENWASTGSALPITRTSPAYTRVGEDLYMYGGCSDLAMGTPTNTIYKATVSNPTAWTNTGKSLPGSSCAASIQTIGNKIYIFGGWSGSASTNKIYSADVSDPATWIDTGKTLPAERSFASSVVIGTYVYLLGGLTPNGSAGTSTIYRAPISDPTSWTNTGSALPAATSASHLAVVGDRVYLFGGFSTASNGTIMSAPISNPTSWTNSGKSIPTPQHGGNLFVIGNKLYLFGGWNSVSGYVTTAISSAAVSDPTTWTNTGKSLPGAPANAASFILGDKAYVAGGRTFTATSTAIFSTDIVYETDPSTITFGGISATNQNIISNDLAYATSPTSSSSGNVPVKLTNSDGSASNEPNFFYISPPTITSASPQQVSTSGGDVITVTGTNFTNNGTLTVGGITVGYTYISPTSISFTAPPRADGQTSISFTSPDGQTATLNNAITYRGPPPTISSVNPAFGPMQAGNSVEITGTNFSPANTGPAVPSNPSTGATVATTGPTNSGSAASVFDENDSTAWICSAGTGCGASSMFAQQAVINRISWKDCHSDRTPRVMILQLYVNGAWETQYTVMNAWQGGDGTGSFSLPLPKQATGVRAYFTDAGGWVGCATLNAHAVSLAKATVSFDGINSDVVIYNSPTKLTARVPAHPTAKVDVAVQDYYNQTATLPQAYTYLPNKYIFASTPLNQAATQPGEIKIRAQDKDGNTVTAASDITLTLSSSSGGGFFATDLNEAEGTRWTHTTAVIPAGQSEATFYYKDNDEGTPTITVTDPLGNSYTQNQTITSKYRFRVTGVTDPIQAGVPSSVTVQAVDYAGVAQPDYVGTITFNSTDGGAVIPGQFTFTPAMKGVKTFVNGVTMATPGEWCIAATDTVKSAITGNQCDITVTSPPLGAPSKFAVISPLQSIPTDGQSSAITVQTQDSSNYPAVNQSDRTVYAISSSGTGLFSKDGVTNWVSASSPLALTIKAGTSAVSVYYKDQSTGSHTITFRDEMNGGTDFGLTNTSQILTVGVGSAAKLGITPSEDTIIAGNTRAYNVSLQDSTGNDITQTENTSVYLSADTSTAKFSSTPGGGGNNGVYTAIIPAGSQYATIYITETTAGETTITASDANPADGETGLDDGEAIMNIDPTSAASLYIDMANSGQVRSMTPLTATLRDIYGNITPYTQNGGITFATTSSTGHFYINTEGTPVASWPTSIGGMGTLLYYTDSTVDTVTLTLSTEGQTATKSFQLDPGPLAGYRIKSPTRTVVAGQPSDAITIEAVDAWGNPTTAPNPTTINLASTSPADMFSLDKDNWASVTSATLPANTSEVTVYYRDTKSGTHTITASDGTAHTQATQNITVTPGTAEGLHFTESPLRIVKNLPKQITVGFVDAYGNTGAVPEQSDTLTFDSSSPTAQFSTDGVNNWGSSPFTLALSNGQATKSFYYRDTATGDAQLSAEANNYDFDQVDIETTEASVFSFSAAPSEVELNTASSAYTVNSQDDNGNVTPVSVDTTVYLYGSGTGGQFSTSATGPWNANQVVIPAGQSSVNFYFRSSEFGDKMITASDASTLDNPDTGFTNATTITNVKAQTVYSMNFVSSPQTFTAGTASGAIRIQVFGAGGAPAIQDGSFTLPLYRAPGGVDYKFMATPDTGASAITQVTIPSGSSYVDFYYTDTVSGVKTIQTDKVLAGSNAILYHDITVSPDNPTSLAFDPSTASGIVEEPSQPIVLSLRDQYNNIATSENKQVNISTSCSGAQLSLNSNGPWLNNISTQINAGAGVITLYYKNTTAETCQINAIASGLQTGTMNYTTVLAADHIEFTSTPKTLIAGQTSDSLTVTFYDEFGNVINIPRDITLNISSSSTTGTATPSQITAPAGASNISFTYRDTNIGSPTITVTGPNGLTAEQTQTITAGTASNIRMTPSKTIFSAGEPITIQLQMLNQYGAVIPAPANTPITLTTSDSSGAYTLGGTDGNSIVATIPAGQSSVTASYQQSEQSPGVTLTADSAYPDQLAYVSVLPATISQIKILNNPINLEAGETASISVQLQDQFGNVVTSPDTLQVYPTTTSSTGQVMIPGGGLIFSPGQSTINFSYRDDVAGIATLRVSEEQNNPSDTGISDATRQINVAWGSPTQIQLRDTPTTLECGGASNQVNVSLLNSHGVRLKPSSDINIYLSSTSADGRFATSATGPWNTTMISIPAGQDTVSFYYRDTQPPGDTIITASDVSAPPESPDTGLTNADATISIKSEQIGSIVVTSPQQTRPAFAPSDPITLELRNPYGYPVEAGENTVLRVQGSANGGFADNDQGPWNASTFAWPEGQSNITVYYRDTTVGVKSLNFSYKDAAQNAPTLASAQQPITITPQTVDHLFVTNISTPQEQGNPSSVVVIAQDAWGNTVESYDGTITFSSDDPTAIIPGSYTFNPSVDRGSHTFTNSVAFRTSGIKKVTATDNNGLMGDQENIIVTGNTAGPIRHLQFINNPEMQNIEANKVIGPLTVQAFDANGKAANGPANGLPVHVTAPAGTEFALSPTGPWMSDLTTLIPEGLTFTTFYFRTTVTQPGTITATDWIDEADSTQITNAILAYTVTTNAADPGDGGNPGDTNTSPGSGGNNPDTTDPGTDNNPSTPIESINQSNAETTNSSDRQDAGTNNDKTAASKTSTEHNRVLFGLVDLEKLKQQINEILQSPTAATVIPNLLYGLVFIFAVILLYQMLMEIQRVRILAGALKRKTELARNRLDFIALSAHYLRTPITILSGALDLAKLNKDNDESLINRFLIPVTNLKAESERILTEVDTNAELQAIQAPNERRMTQRAFASPIFWLPVTLSIILTIIANLLFSQVGNQSLSTMHYIQQMIALSIVTFMLYSVIRGLTIRREEKRLTQEILDQEAVLSEAKNKFILDVRSHLEDDIMAINLLVNDNRLDKKTHEMVETAADQLHSLLEKFEILSSLNGTPELQKSQRLSTVLESARAHIQELADIKHVAIAESLKNVEEYTRNSRLVDYVVSSVLKNAVEYSPEGATIRYSVSENNRGTSIVVEDHGPGMARDPKGLFQPFVRAETAEDFTHEGIGLSLYLDRIIMNYLGGSIDAVSHKGKGTSVQIFLPHAA